MKRSQARFFSVHQLWYFSSIGLAILAIVYGLKGYYHLLFDLDGAIDFKSRWRELQYIYQGHYPHPIITPGSPIYDAEIGSASYGGYFPWSFFSMIALVMPASLGFARIYFGLINLLSMVIISIFLYRRYACYGLVQGLFSIASVWAISAHCTTLGVGQLGIVLNILVIAFLVFLERGKLTFAGIFCGIFLLKPNVTALYFLIPISLKKYWVAIVSGLYVILATMVIAIATHRNPIMLITVPLQGFSNFADQGNSLINVVTGLGISVTWAIVLLVIAGIGGCLVLFRWVGRFSLMQQFAIASVIGRLWTYHRVYDNVMLLFLYLALLDLTFERPSRPHLCMLFLLGASLWVPAGWLESAPAQGLAYIIWVGALIFLLLRTSGKMTPMPSDT